MGSKRIKSNTCIVVLRDEKKHLWFAADRRMSWADYQAIKMPVAKIAKRNGLLFAGTGVGSICSEIVDHFLVGPIKGRMKTQTYMHDILLPFLIDHLRVQGLLAKDERRLAWRETREDILPEDEDFSATILIGVRSDLFEVTLDTKHIEVNQIDAPYGTGCGGHLAWGSLLTTENTRYSIVERLEIAVTVAAKVSIGCDNNIDIIHN